MRLVAPALVAALLGPLGCGAGGAPRPSADVPPAEASLGAPMKAPTNDEPMSSEAANADTLLVSLRPDAARSGTDEPLTLHVEARNPTGEALALLLWNTPFEPTLSADAFAITRDGEPVPYRGRLVKRALPPPDDAVVRLAPGQRYRHAFDLARHYALDEPGTYSIELAPRPVAIDDGSGGGFADLAAADEDPVVVERY